MRRFWRNKGPRICIPIVERTVERVRGAIQQANPLADLIELRVDYLKRPELETLLGAGEKPFIVTNRPQAEGGRFTGDEKTRLVVLRGAVDLGAAFVDVEMRSGQSFLRDLVPSRKGTRLVLSFHDFLKTPSPGELRGLLGCMIRSGADVAKIVTLARSYEDNLKVLSLIPYARGKRQRIVAFCMGEKGKMSRIFAPLMGGAWTYAALDRKRASAPGQLTAQEMKEIWEMLR